MNIEDLRLPAVAAISSVAGFLLGRWDIIRKRREEKALDLFYAGIVAALSQGNGNVRIFEIGSKEFFMAEKLVMRGQMERTGFAGRFTLAHKQHQI